MSKVGRIIFKDVQNMKVSSTSGTTVMVRSAWSQGDITVSPREVKMSTDEGFASDAQRRAAFASGYKAKEQEG